MDPYLWSLEVLRLLPPDPILSRPSAKEILAQESRRLLDEKIANSEECVRQFRSQRNELAPVSRLPPEIMSIIFSYVASPIPYFFTHVSRTWRSVALNSPTLWRVLPSNTQWAKIMLERSKAASLDIRLRFSSYPSSRRVLFWKDVFSGQASRIGKLDLFAISKAILIVLFGDLQPSSLPLHSLQLYQSTRDYPTFPAAVMQTQHLRYLSVAGYNGAWYSLPFHSLTTLKMHNIPKRPNLDEFTEILRGNPQLQNLDMADSLPVAFESMRSIASVDLPNLTSLHLSSTSNPKEVSTILFCITVPPTATLEIDCTNRVPAQDDQDTFLELASSVSVFFSAMPKSEDASYDDVHVEAEEYFLHLRAWKIGKRVWPRKPNIQLKIEPKMPQSPQTMLGQIFSSLPLLNIKSLTLVMDSADILVKETLCNLACLQSVTLVRSCTFDFITALVDKPHDYYEQNSAFYSVTFPTLQTLSIAATSFGPKGIEDLRDCLMERYERNAELTKLKLASCSDIDGDDVKTLEEIVVDVEWDGVEDTSDDFSDIDSLFDGVV